MMKHIRSVGTVAAALAVSMVLVSATASAQAGGGPRGDVLAGAPPSEAFRYGGDDRRDNRRDDRRDDWRGHKHGPDYHTAIRECSRESIQNAWRRGFYSAQYEREPRLVGTRRGWELVGRVRLQDRRGFSFVNTVCDLRPNGQVVSFAVVR